MNVARWAGAFAAVLVIGCAGQKAETRTAAAQPRDTERGGGANQTAAQEQAPSERPSAGVGTQSPHPVVTNPNDPSFSGDKAAREGRVARPGLEGRPGRASGAQAGASASAAGDVKELDEVYGQVNHVTKDEIEIEPAYGDPVKLKLNQQTMGAQASAMPKEGDEVRASYEEHGSDKVAVDVRTGSDAAPANGSTAPNQPMKSEPSGTGSSTTR